MTQTKVHIDDLLTRLANPISEGSHSLGFGRQIRVGAENGAQNGVRVGKGKKMDFR